MSLLFMESFAHMLTTDYGQKYSGVTLGGLSSIQSTLGRRGAPALQSGNGTMWSRTFTPGDTTCIIGFALNLNSAAASDMVRIYDIGGNEQYHIGLNTTRTIYAGRPFASADATSTLLLTVPGYNYIELKVNILDAGGTVDVRVNGVSFISLTGIDTKQSGTAGWNRIDIISGSFPSQICDMYVLDGTGLSPWNNLLGDCRVDVRFGTADGSTLGWAASGISNWSDVDDPTPNGDTDYNSTFTNGTIDTFITQDAPLVGASIYGVQECVSVKKMDGGACAIAPVIRHSGTNNVGADFSPTTAYSYMIRPFQTNPGTGVAWTEAGFNAAEFGYKRTA